MIISKKVLFWIKDTFTSYGWSMWIGFGLGHFFNTSLCDWRWWVFTVTLIILVGISKAKSKHVTIDRTTGNIADGTFFVGKK